MMMLDKEIDTAQALVIDGNPSSRSIITAQLRDLGVPNVVQAPKLADGRRRLETQHFDIVVCEMVFPGEDMTGQELLEDLRLIQDSLRVAGDDRAAFGELQHLIWLSETFGFHLAELEVEPGLGPTPVDRGLAAVDQAARQGPPPDLGLVAEEHVEPRALGRRRNLA